MKKIIRKGKILFGGGFLLISLMIIFLMILAILDEYSVFSITNIITDLLLVGGSAIIGAFLLMSVFEEASNKKKVMHYTILLIAFSYCLALIITLLSNSSMLRHDMFIDEIDSFVLKKEINIIPFNTIYDYIRKGFNNEINIDIVISNLAGNFIMFMPFSFFISTLVTKINTWKQFIIISVSIITIFEILQLLLHAGAFDIDDIILNTAGAFIGYIICRWKPIQYILRKFYMID